MGFFRSLHTRCLGRKPRPKWTAIRGSTHLPRCHVPTSCIHYYNGHNDIFHKVSLSACPYTGVNLAESWSSRFHDAFSVHEGQLGALYKRKFHALRYSCAAHNSGCSQASCYPSSLYQLHHAVSLALVFNPRVSRLPHTAVPKAAMSPTIERS